jgi:polyhydroxybutyrate depolymerase
VYKADMLSLRMLSRSPVVLPCVFGGLLAAGCASAPHGAPAEPKPGAPEAAPAPTPEAATGRPTPPSPSAGCSRPVSAAGALVAHAGKLETPYLLTLPDGYDGKTPVPLVFAFHGRTRSHQSMHDTDASHLAEELGHQYAIAYVKSVGPGYDLPGEEHDNLQIFDALYPQLLGDYCVDTEQVFALGHSSGALFSELLACERAPLLRGIAAVAGTIIQPECPGRSAALMIHGEHDAVVAVTRGRAARDRFLAANGCSAQSTPTGTPGCQRYAGCEPSLPVEWCEHAEPTYQPTTHGWPSFASAEIARFFGALGRVPHAGGTPLLANESFESGSEPWHVNFGGKAKGSSGVKNGALCATLDAAGENPWDAQLEYAGLKLERGRTYDVDYRLWTSAPSDVRVKLGLDAQPYSEYWVQDIAASPEPKRVHDRWVLADPTPGSLALGFQFAGSFARSLPLTLCIDDVSLTLVSKP